eukprot:1160050-Prymnesium_polylepis.1
MVSVWRLKLLRGLTGRPSRRGIWRRRGRGTRRGSGWLRMRSGRPEEEAEGWGASDTEGVVWQENQWLAASGSRLRRRAGGWRLIVH